MKVLLIEDQDRIADGVMEGLSAAGFDLVRARNGAEGLALASGDRYDLIISDIMMPEMTGMEMVKRLRASGFGVPILMVTGLSRTDQKIAGLDAGADDYLTKPFELAELIARAKALIRRSQGMQAHRPLLHFADVELDLDAHTCTRGGTPVELTRREFDLLVYLIRNAGRVVSKQEIARDVWDLHFETGTNVVEVYVSYLRNKIDKPFPTPLIRTAFGKGYTLEGSVAEP